MIALLIAAALAETPAVVVAGLRGTLSLQVVPPDGEHINQTGPFSMSILLDGRVPVQVQGTGALLAEALELRGHHVEGTASVPLCTEDGVRCRVAAVHFRGTATRRPASINTDALPYLAAPPPHTDDLAAALDQASAGGRLVLIDFGAVWCPPCNQLSAEVLDDPGNAADLAPFVIVDVDVDTTESWPVKDRYAVGGYPTLVLADTNGDELDRYVGYPGEEALLDWLSRAAADSARQPATATPAAAAAQARRFVEQGQDARAREWLAAADTVHDSVDYRIARLSLDPSAEDLRWLLTSGAPVDGYLWSALSLDDDDLRPALRAAVSLALASADSEGAADLAWAGAELAADEAARAALYGAAAAAMRASMTGAPDQDRGRWGALATAMERAGDRAGAIALMQQAAQHYPEEFTFHYALARRLLSAEDHAGAVSAAGAALDNSYGDNHLRAANLLAKALHADGQPAAAVALLEETLAAAVVPDEGVEVRTPRYLKALQETRASIGTP